MFECSIFNLVKAASTVTELAVSHQLPNTGIINPDQSGNSLTHLIINGTREGKYIGLIPVPTFIVSLLFSYIA